MKYPHHENTDLRELQDKLAAGLNAAAIGDQPGNGPEAAAAMFEAITAKFTRYMGGRSVFDAEGAAAQARKTLAAHAIDPDGPMPEAPAVAAKDDADRQVAEAEQQLAAAAAAKARKQATTA